MCIRDRISNGQVFTSDSKPNPKTKYAQAKLIAEEHLLALSTKGLPVTIIRPPVVYGPNSKGNINSLINLLASVPCWAIPFGNIKNERSPSEILRKSSFQRKYSKGKESKAK